MLTCQCSSDPTEREINGIIFSMHTVAAVFDSGQRKTKSKIEKPKIANLKIIFSQLFSS